MSKSGSFSLVLTVICLSVLMSLEADAQSTTDETNSCSSSSLDDVVNLVKINALKLEDNAKEIKKIASKSCELETLEPSKQALVSALVSEYLTSTKQHIVQIKSGRYLLQKITKRAVNWWRHLVTHINKKASYHWQPVRCLRQCKVVSVWTATFNMVCMQNNKYVVYCQAYIAAVTFKDHSRSLVMTSVNSLDMI